MKNAASLKVHTAVEPLLGTVGDAHTLPAGARASSQAGSMPSWDANGDPITLAAAALDALAWLEWMRDYLAQNKSTALDQARANLARCAHRLRERIDEAVEAQP